MKKLLTLLFCVTPLLAISCGAQDNTPAKADTSKVKGDIKVLIKTTKGDIEAKIFAKRVPVTSANFLNLAKRGYYCQSPFHRVVPNFVIQGGKHKSGTPTPGYNFDNETYTEHPELNDLKHDAGGILSMARLPQKHTNGAQFFITHEATPHLDGDYTVFGEVTKGLDIVHKIKVGDKILAVQVLDPTEQLFEAVKGKVTIWNKILDRNFPDLAKQAAEQDKLLKADQAEKAAEKKQDEK